MNKISFNCILIACVLLLSGCNCNISDKIAHNRKNISKYNINSSMSDNDVIIVLENAKMKDIDNPELYNMLGICYNNVGDCKNAVHNFLQVVKLSPEYINGYNSVGTSYKDCGDYNKAIEYFVAGIHLCENKLNKDVCASLYQNIASTYYSKQIASTEHTDMLNVIKYSKEGLRYVDCANDITNCTRFNYLIAEAYNKIGEYSIAYAYYKKVANCNKSPWSVEAKHKMSLIEQGAY